VGFVFDQHRIIEFMTTSTSLAVVSAFRKGTRPYYCDAVAHWTASDLTTAAALIDGIGNSARIAETMTALAWVAARMGAQQGGLPALLTCHQLIADPGAGTETPPDGVAVIAVSEPDEDTAIHYVGDARAYGWNGRRLRQFTTDHTVAQQLIVNGAPWEIASDHSNWVRTRLSKATVATVYSVEIPHDELVLLTSDGVHDPVPHEELEELFRRHDGDDQALVDALVTAAPVDEDGYRDDATALLLRPGN
jgi:serine/threonine protein phosphatase PrpC